jgi:glycosyltransferase involved in cell wall biosynthesis
VRIVVAHSHLNALGGGERVTLELLRGLSKRHEVELWAGDYGPAHTFPELAAFPRRDLKPHEWLLLRPDADAVVSNTFGANLLALRHPNTVCYIHTLRSIYLRQRGVTRLAPGLVTRRALDRAALHRAKALATNSEFTARAIQQKYGRPAAVIPCGVAPEFFELPPEPGTYVLYVGRLAPEKGIERLLRWCADLPVDLLVVGAGTPAYEAYLRGIAGPRTTWAGPLAGPALLDAYRGSRLLVFLPHDEEFGLVVLEAMAAARPILTTPEGGIPELVRDGENGRLVRTPEQFREAVLDLLGDSAQGLRMGLVGRAFAQHYRWDEMVRAVERLC